MRIKLGKNTFLSLKINKYFIPNYPPEGLRVNRVSLNEASNTLATFNQKHDLQSFHSLETISMQKI